jgi:hypothetical protein
MPRILAFAGSSRRESINKKLVAIAAHGVGEALATRSDPRYSLHHKFRWCRQKDFRRASAESIARPVGRF